MKNPSDNPIPFDFAMTVIGCAAIGSSFGHAVNGAWIGFGIS